MAGITSGLSRGSRVGLTVGVLLLLMALGGKSWGLGLAAVAVLTVVGRMVYATPAKTLEPWPWPADLRAQAEALARPIDPTPKRILPPDDKASIVAQVATTKDALARLITEKPPAWPWALFASVLVQRRNAVAVRLRGVASGYQPRRGAAALSGQAYSQTAQRAMATILDVLAQMEQFMLSPAFKGAFGEVGIDGDAGADAEAVSGIANRLMDYHETLLSQAEACLQTPVESDTMVFVQDAGALSLLPLVGYDRFISTMCARIGEAQDLLPYSSGGVLELDQVTLKVDMPEGLSERVVAHIKRFNE